MEAVGAAVSPHPVGALLRPIAPANLEDSLAVAARAMRDAGSPVLPIADGGVLAGMVTEADLVAALAAGRSYTDSLDLVARSGPVTIKPYATSSDALRLLERTGAAALVVVDDEMRVLGLVSASDLISPPSVGPRPRMVGGMATPFGVYLTNGAVSGGVGHSALFCTGALLFATFFAATFLAEWFVGAVAPITLSPYWSGHVLGATTLAFFLLGVRLMPLSGTHAAEHMVVHAIERGEDLTPTVVGRMPRVHPRCGTNLAAAVSLFLGVASMPLSLARETQLLAAILVTLLGWRWLGTSLQRYVTTRTPTPRQVQSGIAAGRQLLERYHVSRRSTPRTWTRVWNMGIVQIIAGSAATAWLVTFVAGLFGYPDLIRVI